MNRPPILSNPAQDQARRRAALGLPPLRRRLTARVAVVILAAAVTVALLLFLP